MEAIFVILDVYFQCLRTDGYAVSQPNELKRSRKTLYRHMTNDTVMDFEATSASNVWNGMIKLHIIGQTLEETLNLTNIFTLNWLRETGTQQVKERVLRMRR